MINPNLLHTGHMNGNYRVYQHYEQRSAHPTMQAP